LKKYGVPAILFVATEVIQNRKLAWWDIIAYLIKRCTKSFITVGGRQFSLASSRKEAIAFFLQRMKQEPHEQTQYLLSDLAESCQVALPDALLQDKEILSWEELREMARHQIAIGSHSHSHRVMSTIGIGEQKEEMVLSKQIIEANIGQAVHSISYPVGELRYITAETFAIAESSGYLLGFTANTGVNDWKVMQPYGIKRMAGLMEKVSTVSLLTVLPELFTRDSAKAIK
jgi:peptidoglycan/xylan/chitin deacetylase (PgdA/CDA1 family)